MEQQSTTTATQGQYRYQDTSQVYGIVVDDRLATPMINIGLNALKQKNVDRVVFLCLAPHDIRDRVDWNDIVAHIPYNGTQPEYDVRLVQSPEELLYASLDMRIVRLPVDSVVI